MDTALWVQKTFASAFCHGSANPRPSLFIDTLDEAFFFQFDDEPVIHDILHLDADGRFARERECVDDLDLHALPVHQRHAFEKFGDIVAGAFEIGFVILP